MRAIREILRQRYEFQRSLREISRNVGVSYGAVQGLLHRAEEHGLGWPLSEGQDDEVLERLLYKTAEIGCHRPVSDMAEVDRELRSRKDVTLTLLWQEHKAAHPDGYQYTQFCQHFRAWQKTQDPVMRQPHPFGRHVIFDFAGVTVRYTVPETREVLEAHILVSCLPASAYISAHALPGETLRDWVFGICLVFEDLGGVPESLIIDNPKAAVLEPSRYEPRLNPTFLEMAQHYGVYVETARPRRPRDKAAGENAVQIVERRVLAPLRHRRFFSLAEVEAAIQDGVAALDRLPFQKREGWRLSVFSEQEKPKLRPLPPRRYDFAVWKRAKVNIDYHVEVGKSLYSVPYQLIRQQVDVRLGTTAVTFFQRGRQVAMHARSSHPGAILTQAEHIPPSHRRHAEWTPSRIISWAKEVGPHTADLAKTILDARPHPEMGFRSCIGIIRLARLYGPERLEAACRRALAIRATSFRSVEAILKKGLDRLDLPTASLFSPVSHENIRGAAHFAEEVRSS